MIFFEHHLCSCAETHFIRFQECPSLFFLHLFSFLRYSNSHLIYSYSPFSPKLQWEILTSISCTEPSQCRHSLASLLQRLWCHAHSPSRFLSTTTSSP